MARASTDAVYARLQGPPPAEPGFGTVPEAHLPLAQTPAQEHLFTVSLGGEVDEPGLRISQDDPQSEQPIEASPHRLHSLPVLVALLPPAVGPGLSPPRLRPGQDAPVGFLDDLEGLGQLGQQLVGLLDGEPVLLRHAASPRTPGSSSSEVMRGPRWSGNLPLRS